MEESTQTSEHKHRQMLFPIFIPRVIPAPRSPGHSPPYSFSSTSNDSTFSGRNVRVLSSESALYSQLRTHTSTHISNTSIGPARDTHVVAHEPSMMCVVLENATSGPINKVSKSIPVLSDAGYLEGTPCGI